MNSEMTTSVEASATAERQQPDHTWPEHHFHAMGCEIGLWLDAGEREARPAFARAEALFHRVEARLTRFDEQSELSYLNARPQRWVPVSDLLWRVVRLALSVARATGGLFDPTLLSALEAAGYTVSFAELAASLTGQAAPAAAPHRGRWQEVRLDPDRQAIWLPAGVRLDLGGIGKGYTAQRAVDLLAATGPALVDAGGDLVAGAAPHTLPGWPVAVAAPGGDSAPDLFHLWLAQAALATSGTDYRSWEHNGQQAHHLIDPASGRPAESDVVSATVLAAEAVVAEGWATAALIAGRERGLALLRKHDLAGALTGPDGRTSLTSAFAAHVVWPIL